MFSSEESNSPAIDWALMPPLSSENQSGSSAAVSGASPSASVARFLGRVEPFEQGIALDLLIDEAIELDMRQLQQPYRLHELRRHHQGLRLAQL